MSHSLSHAPSSPSPRAFPSLPRAHASMLALCVVSLGRFPNVDTAPFLDDFHQSKRVSSTTRGPSDPDYTSFLTRITQCRRKPLVDPFDLEAIMSLPRERWTATQQQMAERADTEQIISCVKWVQRRPQNGHPVLRNAIEDISDVLCISS